MKNPARSSAQAAPTEPPRLNFVLSDGRVLLAGGKSGKIRSPFGGGNMISLTPLDTETLVQVALLVTVPGATATLALSGRGGSLNQAFLLLDLLFQNRDLRAGRKNQLLGLAHIQ